MRKFEFYQLDVFTERTFEGNPLAVFPESEGIAEAEMQKIAAEMNLSETVFVFASDLALRRLRIFTPKQELPLAGHPVVGTWNLMARLGVVDSLPDGIVRINQELNLGVLPVDIDFIDGKVSKVTMTQDKFDPGQTITRPEETAKLAEGLGIDQNEIVIRDDLPIQVVSTGIKALDVPLKSLSALEKCKISAGPLSEVYLKYGAVGVYAFSFETIEENSKVHARFFAPADSIPEDPATGSAAGSFAGYAVHNGAIKPGDFVIEQGDFMNRPSRIEASVSGAPMNVGQVRIGGKSVVVAKGEMFLP